MSEKAVKTDDIEDIGSASPSTTYEAQTSCFTIYVTIVFKIEAPEKVDYIKIAGVNRSLCGNCFYEALADSVSFSIRRIRNIHEAKAIVKNLRYHRCNNVAPNPKKYLSCVDAVGAILERVLIKDEDKKA